MIRRTAWCSSCSRLKPITVMVPVNETRQTEKDPGRQVKASLECGHSLTIVTGRLKAAG